jgi:hypothetical protein
MDRMPRNGLGIGSPRLGAEGREEIASRDDRAIEPMQTKRKTWPSAAGAGYDRFGRAAC